MDNITYYAAAGECCLLRKSYVIRSPTFLTPPTLQSMIVWSRTTRNTNRETMRISTPLVKLWPALLAGGLALGALALLWRVRDTPLALGAFVRFDALSAFFLFALFGGVTLALVARPTSFSPRWLCPAAAAGALALAYSTTLTLAVACAYLALALLTLDWQALAMHEEDRPTTPANRAMHALRRATSAAPGLLAAVCLMLGCGALARRGA